MKLRILPPGARSGLILLLLACMTLFVVINLGRSEVGAAALSLFQSPPSSPVGTPAARAAATATQAFSPPAAGSSILLWVIVGVVAVVALLILGILLFRRRR